MPKTIQYLGVNYREVDALWGFGKKKDKPVKPEQKSDTKVLGGDTEVVTQNKSQPSGLNDKQKAELTKIFTAARNAYMDLVAFFKPQLPANSLTPYNAMFEQSTPRDQKIKLGDQFIMAMNGGGGNEGMIPHVVNVYKNDQRPEKKKIYDEYKSKFSQGDPTAPVVKFISTLKSFAK